MLDEVKITKDAYDKIFSEYASKNSTLNDDVKALLDKFSTLLNGKKVLDIGCAQGRESKYLFLKGLDVTGIDISSKFIGIASKNCKECKFITMDMRKLDFPEESFNGIWANASFLHIPKSEAKDTLNGFKRILQSGGVIFINVMMGEFDSLRENKDMNWPGRHFSDYKVEEIEKLFSDCGLSIIEFQKVETSWGKVFLNYFISK